MVKGFQENNLSTTERSPHTPFSNTQKITNTKTIQSYHLKKENGKNNPKKHCIVIPDFFYFLFSKTTLGWVASTDLFVFKTFFLIVVQNKDKKSKRREIKRGVPYLLSTKRKTERKVVKNQLPELCCIYLCNKQTRKETLIRTCCKKYDTHQAKAFVCLISKCVFSLCVVSKSLCPVLLSQCQTS